MINHYLQKRSMGEDNLSVYITNIICIYVYMYICIYIATIQQFVFLE